MKSYTVQSFCHLLAEWSLPIVTFLDGAFDCDGWNMMRQMIQDCEWVTLCGERIAFITTSFNVIQSKYKLSEILYCAIVLPSLGWVESPNLIWSWRMKCAETDDSRLLWISDARWRENCPNHNFFKCNSKWIQNLRILTLCNSVAISWLSGVSQ